jgi:hypothetical protein
VVITIKTNKIWLAAKAIIFTSLAALMLVIIAFGCYYLFSGHDHLADWYLHLNSCFYRAQYWNATVFTKGIKSDGNMYCVIGMAIAVAGIFYIFRRVRLNIALTRPAVIKLHIYDLLLIIAALAMAVTLWLWGNNMALPAYDEAFSAENVAGIHPFQSASYYMLPNNHIFYNLLNNLLFHTATDKVFTGRILSLVVYCSFITIIFLWFKNLIHNRWLAFIISIVLAMQFEVWGFSFQARGYELYLLCEWGLFISLFSYIRSANKRWLLLNALCCAAGYFCMPSYLYFHVAQLVFMLLYQLFYLKKEGLFWKYQLFAIFLAFLLYLPALCFSGLEAIINNPYVAPMKTYKTTTGFWAWMYPAILPGYLSHIFSDIYWQGYLINRILFFLPVTLLLNRKNKTSVLFGLFYVALWAVLFIIVIAMKRVPFERNLIGHYSVTLAGVILVAYWLTSFRLPAKINLPRIILLPLILLAFIIHFIRNDKKLLKDKLYEYDVNQVYDTLNTGLHFISPGSTVAFSDESFYCRYICKKNGCKAGKCSTGTEAYFIKQTDENVPLPLPDQYTLIKKVDIYSIYKRK